MSDRVKFRFSYPIQVRFGDMDAMGHVNNAKFFTYMESGRVQYMDTVVHQGEPTGQPEMILAHTSCDFKRPLTVGDDVRIFVRTMGFGRTSFRLEYLILAAQDKLVVATGESIQVAYDYNEARSVPLPARWKERIEAYEPALGDNHEG